MIYVDHSLADSRRSLPVFDDVDDDQPSHRRLTSVTPS
jgi:hypothetical protein